jgi:hypothetical protein
VSGRYYKESREARMNPLGQDEALAKALWQRSEEWTS